MVRPEDYGAAGDGVADDTRAVQAALDAGDGAGVLLAGRSYRTTAPLLVGSGTVVQGFGAVIAASADDRPVLVSRAWDDPRAAVRGRTRLLGLRIAGAGRGGPRQDGIVLHDFWSEIADCELAGLGGRGIVLTAADRRGTPIASTLVENRVRRCTVRDSGRTCFALGEPANGKLTDGEISDCLASLREGARDTLVSIGHAAGWAVRNIHTYGGATATAVEIRQGYFTRVEGLYIEGFSTAGLALPAVQTDVTVSDVQIVADRTGPDAAFIALSAHKNYPNPLVSFSNTVLTHLGQAPVRALVDENGRVALAGTLPRVAGPGAAQVRRGDLPEDATPPAGRPAAPATPGGGHRTIAWNGRARQVVEVASRPAGMPFAESWTVAIAARSADGAVGTSFAGMLQWSLGQNGPAVLVDIVPFAEPAGFVTPPAAAFQTAGDRLVLTLAFTPAAAGPGMLTIA